MNRRQARLIRAGIRAARDPKLGQYVHLAPRLVRKTCRRELENIKWDAELARLRVNRQAWMLAAINSEHPEHIRRLHA